MKSDRMDKVNELVKKQLAEEVLDLFPDEIIGVTGVEVSRDLSVAKVWVASGQKSDKAAELLNQSSNLLMHSLSQELVMRRMPRLHFVPDKAGLAADHIDKLLKSIE